MSSASTIDPAIAISVGAVVKVHGRGAVKVRALDEVTCDLRQGELTAIMGPSGAGKSTLLHCMAALERIDSGRIIVDGDDLGALTDRRRAVLRRDRLGFVFQSSNLVPSLTAWENITLPLLLARRRPEAAWLDHVVDLLVIGDRLSHRPSELSGGQQQRVALARALANRPAVVFADEPTGNLDSRAAASVLGLLRKIVADHGQTTVMVTHDAAAAASADRVLFLLDGRVASDLSAPSRQDVLDQLLDLEG